MAGDLQISYSMYFGFRRSMLIEWMDKWVNLDRSCRRDLRRVAKIWKINEKKTKTKKMSKLR